MISIGKCPYRISFLGGGSDLDWFVNDYHEGFSLGFSLDKYSYSIIKQRDRNSDHGILNYSTREKYQKIDHIAHPLIRESLKFLNIKRFIEFSSYGFATGGGGLGGSSSFLLSFISSINNSFELKMTKNEIIKIACKIEIEVLGKPIGRQDQYLCGSGGINAFSYKKGGIVESVQLTDTQFKVIKETTNNLILVPTSRSRYADNILSKFKDSDESIESIKKIGQYCEEFFNNKSRSFEVIKSHFYELIIKSWEEKKKMTNVMDDQLNGQLYDISSIPNHWIRLIGAGSGGYFLICPKFDSSDAISKLKKKGYFAIKANVSSSGIESHTI